MTKLALFFLSLMLTACAGSNQVMNGNTKYKGMKKSRCVRCSNMKELPNHAAIR